MTMEVINEDSGSVGCFVNLFQQEIRYVRILVVVLKLMVFGVRSAEVTVP